MDYGKLYGVGVGPGDKELITIKAVRIIKEADIIAVPLMRNGSKTAFDIAKEYIDKEKVIEFYMPMSKDYDKLNENYTKIAHELEDYLKEGKNVAFLTLGDPSVYSTYMQINRIVLDDGFETEIIAGVTSFCAAAARLNMPLCERDEPLIILPASYKETEAMVDLYGTKVMMKASREINNVVHMLKEKDLLKKSVLVENCGMAGERIVKEIDENETNSGYFSIVIVK